MAFVFHRSAGNQLLPRRGLFLLVFRVTEGKEKKLGGGEGGGGGGGVFVSSVV